MTSLADQFQEAAQAGVRSDFDKWVDQHPERDVLLQFAASPAISHNAFLRVVKNAGAKVGKDKIADWRKAHGYDAR